jgi:hypothetical protein
MLLSKLNFHGDLKRIIFYEGHCVSYFARSEESADFAEKATHHQERLSGCMSEQDWFAPLGDLAKLNIRDLPAPKP